MFRRVEAGPHGVPRHSANTFNVDCKRFSTSHSSRFRDYIEMGPVKNMQKIYKAMLEAAPGSD